MTKEENPQTQERDFPLSWKAQTPRFPHSHRTATAAVASTPNQNHNHGLRYSLPSRLTHRFVGGGKDRRAGPGEVWAHGVIAAGERGGANHGAGLCIDLGESATIREESGCGTVPGIGAEARRFGREPAAIRNQQSRRYDGAQAAGRERAVYLGAVWTGHEPTTIWVEAL